eukprot:1161972-Pelagomonas_calceolata.AAC.1
MATRAVHVLSGMHNCTGSSLSTISRPWWQDLHKCACQIWIYIHIYKLRPCMQTIHTHMQAMLCSLCAEGLPGAPVTAPGLRSWARAVARCRCDCASCTLDGPLGTLPCRGTRLGVERDAGTQLQLGSIFSCKGKQRIAAQKFFLAQREKETLFRGSANRVWKPWQDHQQEEWCERLAGAVIVDAAS